jgi:hypothetical protein
MTYRQHLIDTLVDIDMDRIMRPNDVDDAEHLLHSILRHGWIGYNMMLTPQLEDMLREITDARKDRDE